MAAGACAYTGIYTRLLLLSVQPRRLSTHQIRLRLLLS